MPAIPTCAVLARLYDQNGQAVVGASITAQLDRYEIHDGFVVPQRVEAITDIYGEATLNLWPNSLGSQSSSYKIKVQPTDTKGYSTIAIVPDTPTAELSEIAQLPEHPGKADFEEFFEQAQGLATDLVNNANAAKTDAQAAQAAAAGSATAAADNAADAASEAAAALVSAQSAQTSANAAEASRIGAGQAEFNADASEAAAAASATAAGTSATAAAGSATNAAASATAAAGSATAASGSATAAAGSATTASTQAGNAATSATAAATSANNAATSESNALTSKNAAATSATSAATSETNAAGSATAAATSATNAGNSATAAATSATNASNAKTAAETARDLAQGYATSITPTVAKPGDAAVTMGRVVNAVVIYAVPITANRAVTLNTTDPETGDAVRVVRSAGATGGFTVGLGALKTLTAGQFAEAVYDGSAWVLTSFGSL